MHISPVLFGMINKIRIEVKPEQQYDIIKTPYITITSACAVYKHHRTNTARVPHTIFMSILDNVRFCAVSVWW